MPKEKATKSYRLRNFLIMYGKSVFLEHYFILYFFFLIFDVNVIVSF